MWGGLVKHNYELRREGWDGITFGGRPIEVRVQLTFVNGGEGGRGEGHQLIFCVFPTFLGASLLINISQFVIGTCVFNKCFQPYVSKSSLGKKNSLEAVNELCV